MAAPSVLLIGGLPRPSGGVTVFLGRLVNAIGDRVDFDVLDIHPGEKEPSRAVRHRICPAGRLRRNFFIYRNIVTSHCNIVHFNHSSWKSLIALLLLPKLGRRFFITLHNGEQVAEWRGAGSVMRRLSTWGARKIDCAFSLCADHDDFYRDLGLAGERVVRTKSQIPPPDIKPGFLNEQHRRLRERVRAIMVSSGHLDRIYNFEFVIRYVNEHTDFGGMLFLYGPMHDTDYLDRLKAMIDRPANFLMFFHKTEAEFLAALRTADTYLRPSYVDSWGVAVADAIALNVPAVASDVCERAAGAIICNATDFEDFSAAVDRALDSGDAVGSQEPLDCARQFLEAYSTPGDHECFSRRSKHRPH